ncbi:MAG: hypothetical protein HC848_00130 [Limnobacter sp.]|nr:hypothetical protein [Limnobacter sp.]
MSSGDLSDKVVIVEPRPLVRTLLGSILTRLAPSVQLVAWCQAEELSGLNTWPRLVVLNPDCFDNDHSARLFMRHFQAVADKTVLLFTQDAHAVSTLLHGMDCKKALHFVDLKARPVQATAIVARACQASGLMDSLPDPATQKTSGLGH